MNSTSPTTRFTQNRLTPAFSGFARMMPVRVPGLANWQQGQVLAFLTGTGSPVNEVHRYTFGGSPDGGTFRIQFGTEVSGAIAWSGTAATLAANIQAALRAMPSINGANVAVTGTGPFDATFSAALAAKNIPIPTVISSLTGTSPTLAITEQAVGHPGAALAFPYDDTKSDGREVAKGVLVRAVQTNLAGELIEDGPGSYTSAGMYFEGPFYCGDLVGLDAAAVTDLGRIVNGIPYTVAGAVLLIR